MTAPDAKEPPYTGTVELRRLRYFVVLARELHFGRASEVLHIAQPGLSQQIQVLENELGVRLFERSRKGVTVTPVGRILAAEAEELLRHADAFQAKAAAISSGEQGTLRIAHNRSTPELGAAKLLGEFREKFPQITIEIESGWTAHNLTLLRAGDADAVFVRLPLIDTVGVDFFALGSSELMAVLPTTHPLALQERIPRQEFARHPVVMWPRRQSPGYYDHQVEAVWGAEGPSIVSEEPDASYVLAAVQAGVGVSVLDRRRAELLAPDGVVVKRFEDPVPQAGYGVAWAESEHPPPALEQFLLFAKEWLSRG